MWDWNRRTPKYHEDSRLGAVFGWARVILVLTALIWGSQIVSFRMSKESVERMEHNREHYTIFNAYVNKADKEMGSFDYRKTPAKKYCSLFFGGLKRIRLRGVSLGFPYLDAVNGTGMMSPADRYIQNNSPVYKWREMPPSDKELAIYRKAFAEYEKWAAKLPRAPEGPVFESVRKAGVKGVSRWFGILYLRLMPFAFAFYLLSMLQMGGWIEVRKKVGSNPLRFLLAVALYPVYGWVYPYEELKDLWIEAQIRRIGPLFRKLSKAERRTVERIAGLDKVERSRWIGSFERRNKGAIVRSAYVAMFAVILIHIFCAFFAPTPCSAHEEDVAAVARAGPIAWAEMGEWDLGLVTLDEAILPETGPPIPPLIILWRIAQKKFLLTARVRKILHVPALGWLGATEFAF